MRKRVLKISALLLLAAGGVYFCLENKSTVTGLLMLFQQNSTLSLVGWLNKAENTALTTVFLSAFQAFAMPFKTSPRIVMAAAIAATACTEPVTILGAEAVRKSYPDFFDVYQALGGDIHVL